uniref:Cyanate hydratase n=2 Tax=Wuchereria bancrofti TaxID=6293 RepID=A0AAF5PG78_WUCBA
MRRSIANVLEGSGIISVEVMKSRQDVTNLILATKVQKGVTWKSVAEKIGKSKEWTTAACLGQMVMSKEQAEKVAEIFDLPESALLWLQTASQKGTPGIPSDPILYRLHEVITVYGPTIKELIVEEFGDGIMSAIDFNLTVAREKNEQGDRVSLVLSGKFLPYKDF